MRFTEPLEGRVPYLYVDIKGLVTCGVGNLVDPINEALKLPWKLGNGDALPSEIRADWEALKAEDHRRINDKDPKTVPLRQLHHKFAAPYTRVRLTDADINTLVISKLLANEAFMRKALYRWDEFPADAQLACCSMAWALGPGFPATFKNFAKAVNDLDWLAAKASCKIKSENNPGVVPRNRANELCLDNATTVAENGSDPAVLHWPNAAPRLADAAAPGRPMAMAGQFSVTETLMPDALRDMSRDTDPDDLVPDTIRDTRSAKSDPPPRQS
jgi:hypothetical protein